MDSVKRGKVTFLVTFLHKTFHETPVLLSRHWNGLIFESDVNQEGADLFPEGLDPRVSGKGSPDLNILLESENSPMMW